MKYVSVTNEAEDQLSAHFYILLFSVSVYNLQSVPKGYDLNDTELQIQNWTHLCVSDESNTLQR